MNASTIQLPSDIEAALLAYDSAWDEVAGGVPCDDLKTAMHKRAVRDEAERTLRALLAPLCADKVRLEWMQENLSGRSTPLKHEYHDDDSETWYLQTSYDLRGPTFTQGPSLRAAIDAAREVTP